VLDVQLAALDKDNKVLPAGKVGEVCIQGPNVTKGYLNRPEANEEAFAGAFRSPPALCCHFSLCIPSCTIPRAFLHAMQLNLCCACLPTSLPAELGSF